MHERTVWWCAVAVFVVAACAPHRDAVQPLPAAVSSASLTPAASPSPRQDAELSAFLPTGATLGLSARGDLDADGDDDALMVYASASASDDAPRTLLLLLRGADGVLRTSVVSPNAILCKRCGGMMGDPLQGIRADRGTFTLRFEGGSRELWSSEYSFDYARDRRVWALAGIVFNGFDRADGQSAEQRQLPADFGDVGLDSFDPTRFPADALP